MKYTTYLLHLVLIISFSLFSCQSNKKDNETINNSEHIEENKTAVIDIKTDAKKIVKKGVPEIQLEKDESLATEEEINKMISDEKVKNLNDNQKIVQSFLKACANKDYTSVAKFMAYKGNDKSRINKDSFNAENSSELNVVKATGDIIYGFIKESKEYQFLTYIEKGNLATVEVSFFKKGLGINRRFFDVIDSPKGKIIIGMR